ncbi:MAG: phospho-sugar mutase [Nakamurella sp.]
MTTLPKKLRDDTISWIAGDPCEADRHELKAILAHAMAGNDAAAEDLTARAGAPLRFGTAGLRGPLRAGPSGMNLAVVRRAAAGIASYLVANGGAGRTVVVGHDARHRSAEFAADAAGVLAAAGFTALLAPGALPTPVTAFAVQKLDAAAALQVTASHNPPNDNGLKVYLAGGAQIVSPADQEIEAAIAAQPAAIVIDATGTPTPWPANLLPQYVARIAALPHGTARTLKIAATPMHGVGGKTLIEAFAAAGFTDVTLVAEQAEPDPDFPTVAFPNPEEPGATDLLLTLAARIGADIAIAVDPDADRCSAGVPLDPQHKGGAWRMLRGDETGALLGEYVLANLDRTAHPDPLVATTIVSSELLRHIAAVHSARYDETLTGFKWIVRAGDGAGTGLVYGYEEALGHCVDPDFVRDKDGISASALMCDLAATLATSGRTLLDALDDLARAHGLHLTDQLSVRVSDLSLISGAMARLRSAPPSVLAGEEVTELVDVLPKTDAVILRSHHRRVVVRPSGTEPKLKCYLEVVAKVPADAADLSDARSHAQAELAELREDMAQAIGL